MKALAMILALFFSMNEMHATNNSNSNKSKKDPTKKEKLQTSINHQINRHMYYPSEGVEGKADVMLQVMPEGDMHVVLIQSANPLVKKFIERQVKKMKVDKNEVVAGEIFKYRLVFKVKE